MPNGSSPSILEGLWVATEDKPSCEHLGTEPRRRFVRLRRSAAGLELVRLGLDVPNDELNDPGYEECRAPLQLDGEVATAKPYFCSPRRLDKDGFASDALQIVVAEDEFSLAGAELREHRVNSADLGYGRHDCPGTYNLSYQRSDDDDSPHAIPRTPPHVAGDWRSISRGADGSPLSELEIHFDQVGATVSGDCFVSPIFAISLRGTLTGSHLCGTYTTSTNPEPTPIDLTFSADEFRFNGTWSKDGVWQGVW